MIAYRERLALITFIVIFAITGVYLVSRSEAATGVDVVVTSVTMSPVAPTAGQPVTFAATVKNQGTGPTDAGSVLGVSFAVDGQRVTWNESATASLAAGATTTLTANAGTYGAQWTAKPGSHTIVATADSTNAVANELSETNNTKSLDFTVATSGKLYISPATLTAPLGSTAEVAVRFTPGTSADGATATLTYDQTKLEFVSLDGTASLFDLELGPQTGGSGKVVLTRGTFAPSGVTVDTILSKVRFKALVGSGSTTIQLAGNTTLNGVYTNPTLVNGTLTLTTPDTTAPTVSLAVPSAPVLVGLQGFTATATDSIGVTKVELYVDGQLKSTLTSAPYAFSFDTIALADGTHTVQAKAYDAAGNVGSSTVSTISTKNLKEDINQDGQVNLVDFSVLATKFGQIGPNLGRADINADGRIDLLDFSLLVNKFGA